MQRPLPVNLQIAQGEAVGRPSALYLEVSEQRKVFVGGEVIEIARGSLCIN
jgi:predicted PhzF superfamily epimerase YddE/YHI9